MAVAREQITGTTPQDINKMNKNMETLWFKLFGNLEMSDTNSEFIKNVMTQWIPIQGEGNLDVNNPYRLRFYIPPNTKNITKTSINVQIERYKMDSSITEGGGRYLKSDISISTASTNTSMSSTTVGVSSVGGGGSASTSTSQVDSWYVREDMGGHFPPATVPILYADAIQDSGKYHYNNFSGDSVLALTLSSSALIEGSVVDMFYLNHEHKVNVTVPAHSHSISLQPHTHTMEPHTHQGSIAIDIPDHTHALKEGIKVASVAPADVNVKLNGISIVVLNGDSASKNDINVSEYINIGEWNTIECTTSNLARINIYGVIELVQKFNVLK